MSFDPLLIKSRKELTPGGYEWLEYDSRSSANHPGKDYNQGVGDSDLGKPVVAADFGRGFKISFGNAGYGNQIILEHYGGLLYSRSAHLSAINIKEGQIVSALETVGKLGKSGTSSAHCHFELFTPELLAYAKTRKKDWWNYYPVYKSKAWISQMYRNPDEWLTEYVLIKSDTRPEVYAVNRAGLKHWIVDPAQYKAGLAANKWKDFITTRPQAFVDAIPNAPGLNVCI